MKLVLLPHPQPSKVGTVHKLKSGPPAICAEDAYACWRNVDLAFQEAFITEILKAVTAEIIRLTREHQSDLLSTLKGYLQHFLPVVTASGQDVDFFVARSIDLFQEYYSCLPLCPEATSVDAHGSSYPSREQTNLTRMQHKRKFE